MLPEPAREYYLRSAVLFEQCFHKICARTKRANYEDGFLWFFASPNHTAAKYAAASTMLKYFVGFMAHEVHCLRRIANNSLVQWSENSD